jgi:hypothetical protein
MHVFSSFAPWWALRALKQKMVMAVNVYMHAFSSLAALRPRGLNQKMHLHCTHACIFKF